LEGLRAAEAAGLGPIKLNCVVIRGTNDDEVADFARFARSSGYQVRFIEFMPLDADDCWQPDRVLPGSRIRAILESGIGPLEPLPRDDPSQPATDFCFADGRGRIGFINPVSEPFCGDCNRLRITADGKIRNCLFSLEEWDARTVLREGGTDEDVANLMRDCVLHKKVGHGINTPDFVKPERAMFQIGG